MTPQEQEAFARGRLQGLKEMDKAFQAAIGAGLYGIPVHEKFHVVCDSYDYKLPKLRQEYQQSN